MRTPAAQLCALVAVVALAAVGACRQGGGAATPEVLEEGIGRYRAATGAPDTAGASAPAAPVARYLRVTVLDGTGVVEMDTMGGDSDVYVTVVYGGEKRETAVDEDTEEPRWHDSFVFGYAEGRPLEVSLWDDDPIPQPDQLLGTVTIFPEDGPGFGERTVAFKEGDNGTVRLRLELVP